MMGTSYDVSEGVTPKFALSLFTVEEFQTFWPEIEKMLDQVPNSWKQWTKEYICEFVESGRLQVWGLGRPPQITLVFITTVCVYPAMKVLSIEWGAGEFEDEMLPLGAAALTNYAKLNGCSEIEVKGRLGWEAKWKLVGGVREYSVWSLPVDKGHMN